jgi:hypothetical protein
VRRWGPLFLATLATALLALAVGNAGNLVSAGSPRAPQLKTVSTTTLSRLGLSLEATAQPPYCGLTNTVPRPGWLTTPPVGCAVPRPAAEAAARSGSHNVRVIEDVLALVTSAPPTLVGRDHLTWLVVIQRTGLAPLYGGVCPSQAGGFTACLGGWSRGSSWLVLVDARTAGVINTLPLTAPTFRPGRARGGIVPARA